MLLLTNEHPAASHGHFFHGWQKKGIAHCLANLRACGPIRMASLRGRYIQVTCKAILILSRSSKNSYVEISFSLNFF